nr:putative ribonuclease H-like domain-containing protein [Tanacetum cinerariifolium]
MNQFCEMKGILRQFSVARTPQQNGVLMKRNRTLIDAARTMLADSKLPTTFWAEAVSTACYVQNRVLVVKPHNKTPYKLFMIMEENLYIRFSESTPNVVGIQSNGFTGTKASDNAGQARKEIEHVNDYFLLPLWTADLPFSQDPKSSHDDGSKPASDDGKKGIVIRNKARLLAQGYTQEEGIDYDEVFSHVVKNEAIQLFLAYASFKDFVVYQMDVKGIFLYGKFKEELYVCKTPGIEDPNFSYRVYMVIKSLYGLHQAPRSWYQTLSTYLLDNGFQRGKIDKTLFIKRHKGDILLMSFMGELIFFLGLQVKQKKDGIFISQDKYVTKILKKFRFIEVNTASTLMETQKPLLKDKDGEEVDVHMYRSMIGSLMYLTSSRPDIMFAVYACARYQVNPKISHLHVVKRIFRGF